MLTEEDQKIWAHIAAQLQPLGGASRLVPIPLPMKAGAVAMPSPAPRNGFAPQKTAATPSPLQPLPQREAKRRFKVAPTIEATLDLHGMTQHHAHEAVERFVLRAQREGKRHLAIITGKGRLGEGVLRRAVPQWLEAPHLRGALSALRYAPADKGGEGVLHLLLKRSDTH